MNLYILSTMKRILFISLMIVGVAISAQAQNNNIWSLQRCIDYALENNLRLKQSGLNLEISRLDLENSRSARYPNLNFGTNYNFNFGRTVDVSTNEFISENNQTMSLGASSSVTLFSGFQLSNQIKRDQINLLASELDLKQGEMDLILQVAQAYLLVLFNGEILQSAEVQLSSTKEQRDRTSKLVKAGNLARASLLELESQIATDELAIVNARNQLEIAHVNLQQLMLLDLEGPFGIEKPNLDAPGSGILSSTPNEVYSIAINNQPFIQSADMQVESAAIDIKIAESGKYPTVTLSGNVNSFFSNKNQERLNPVERAIPSTVLIDDVEATLTQTFNVPQFNPEYSYFDQINDARGSGISLGLNIPIYNRGVVKNNIARAQVGYKNAKLNADIQRQVLQQTIEQAYLDVTQAFSTFTATERQINALELTFENSEKQFNLGMINSVDYLIAKNNLNRARNDLVRNKFDFLFKTKILDFYQGKPIGF